LGDSLLSRTVAWREDLVAGLLSAALRSRLTLIPFVLVAGITFELRFGDLDAADFAGAVARDGAGFGPDFGLAFCTVFLEERAAAEERAGAFFGAGFAGALLRAGAFAAGFAALGAGLRGEDFFEPLLLLDEAVFFAAGFA
jgi:hypothetical protein